MSSRWVDVAVPGSGLMDMGLDERRRARFAFNIVATKEGSADFEAEIAAVLVAGGMNAADIFQTSKAVLPDDDGPYLTVTASGGLPPMRVHNLITGPKYFRNSAMCMAVGLNTVGTKNLAWQAFGLLTPVKDQTVVA